MTAKLVDFVCDLPSVSTAFGETVGTSEVCVQYVPMTVTRVKWREHKFDHSRPSSVEVNNKRS